MISVTDTTTKYFWKTSRKEKFLSIPFLWSIVAFGEVGVAGFIRNDVPRFRFRNFFDCTWFMMRCFFLQLIRNKNYSVVRCLLRWLADLSGYTGDFNLLFFLVSVWSGLLCVCWGLIDTLLLWCYMVHRNLWCTVLVTLRFSSMFLVFF